MATTQKGPARGYMALVKKFPLVPIRDQKHLEEAFAVLDDLLQKDLEAWGEEYLEALCILVEDYEKEHAPIPDASAIAVLRELMSQHDLNQTQLEKATRLRQSAISAALSGERQLSKGHIVKLAGFFKVSPAVFLPAGQSE